MSPSRLVGCIAVTLLSCSTTASTPEGTTSRPAVRTTNGLEVQLPLRATDAFSIATRELAIGFRLEGARDAAQREVLGSETVYRGASPDGGDIVVRGAEGSFEDFVHFNSAVREARYVLALTHGVAGIRVIEDAIELLDAGGAPRLRMAPPYVIDAHGARHAAHTTVHGCAVDNSAVPPWGRSMYPFDEPRTAISPGRA